jgi:hypothetical protein
MVSELWMDGQRRVIGTSGPLTGEERKNTKRARDQVFTIVPAIQAQ